MKIKGASGAAAEVGGIWNYRADPYIDPSSIIANSSALRWLR